MAISPPVGALHLGYQNQEVDKHMIFPLTHSSFILLGRSLCSGWLQFRYSLRHVSRALFILGTGLI